MMRSLLLSSFAAVAVAACHQQDPVADDANGTALPAPADHAVPNADETPPSNEVDANAAGPSAALAIPAALRGRWGLTPGDCTSTRGDAKGLLTIGAADLRFYESRALPGTDVETDAASMSGHFNFTGEGQSWSKFQSLRANGNTLVRTETNPAASFTYAKC